MQNGTCDSFAHLPAMRGRRFARCFCRYSGNIANDISYIIKKSPGLYAGAGEKIDRRQSLVNLPLSQYFIHEFDDAVRDVIFDLRIVVDLMTESGIESWCREKRSTNTKVWRRFLL